MFYWLLFHLFYEAIYFVVNMVYVGKDVIVINIFRIKVVPGRYHKAKKLVVLRIFGPSGENRHVQKTARSPFGRPCDLCGQLVSENRRFPFFAECAIPLLNIPGCT